jgi:hypothetical protein
MITLDSIVKNYIIEKGDSSKHGYQRFLQLAINGMHDMNYDVSGQHRFLECTVDDQASIVIPNDNIKVIGIYGLDDKGRWFPFARDRKQSMSVGEKCGVPQRTIGDSKVNLLDPFYLNAFGYVSESYTNHYRNGENTGGYYNQPGGNPYTFRVNEQTRRIELSSNTTNKVILEYLPKSIQVNGQYLVHEFLQESLLAWIRYASVRSKKNYPQGDIQVLKRDYNNFKRLAKLRYRGFTAADFKNAFRSAYLATYKF